MSSEFDRVPRPEPWGKLDRAAAQIDPATAPRLTLVAHSIDVAGVLAALLSLPTVRRRMETLARRRLTDTDLARLTALTFLHDVGKTSSGFYRQCLPWATQSQWVRQYPQAEFARGHTAVVSSLLFGRPRGPWADLQRAVHLDDICEWHAPGPRAAGPVLWLAAISHHGLPLNQIAFSGTPAMDRMAPSEVWTTPIAGYSPLEGLRRLGAAARSLFADAWASDAAAPLPDASEFTHAFAGLVSLADWIGSNTHPDYFPYDLAAQDETRWPVATARAAEVLCRMRIDVEEARRQLRARAPTFLEVLGFAPTAVQVAAADLSLGPVVVLESETGSGKTEAALWRFKSLFESGEVDALAFLLPTRVAATAIQKRVGAFMTRLFPDESLRPQVVLAVPGYLRVDQTDADGVMPGFQVLWPDPTGEKTPLYWAAENSKRYFSAAAAVGTIDQLLLSAMEVKHAHMRGAALLRSLVVVDEVHASDPYMQRLLTAALERQAAAGGHALLLSATLTGEARAQLVGAGAPKGRERQDVISRLADPLAPYPCLADATGAKQALSDTESAALRQKHVHVRCADCLRDPDAVASVTAEAIAEGAKVLVVRNTVGLAVQTQQALEARLGLDHPALARCGQPGREVPVMHHGRYAAADRRLLDEMVERCFGKLAAESREPAVVIGTQTLEISLDCDADLLITDIAPMDVLLQRIGRLHRHRARDAHRPSGYKTPLLLVLYPKGRDLSPLLGKPAPRGLGIGPKSAYESVLAVEATLQVLEQRRVLEIPRHNRELVESCIDTERLRRLAQAMGGKWPTHADELYGRKAAQVGQAARRTLSWSTPWDELASVDREEDVRTRLGLDARTFQLPAEWTSPLGARLIEVSLPGWMLPDAPGDAALESVEDLGAELRFSVAGRDFSYSRLGLAMLPRR